MEMHTLVTCSAKKKKSVLQMPSEPEHIHTQGTQDSKWDVTGIPASHEMLAVLLPVQGPVSLFI